MLNPPPPSRALPLPLCAGFDPYLTEGLLLRAGDGNNGYMEGTLAVAPGGIPILFNTANDTAAGGERRAARVSPAPWGGGGAAWRPAGM